MYRIEIRRGWEVIQEYESEYDKEGILQQAIDDGWIDCYFGDGYVIKEDAWMYDKVDKVLLLEGNPDIFEEVILEITKLERLDEEEY